MYYVTASILMSLIISNINFLPGNFTGSQDNGLNHSMEKTYCVL